VFSVLFMAAYGAQPFGSLAAGYALSALGAPATIGALAALTLLLAIGGALSAGIRAAPRLAQARALAQA
jgi:hypothetical protein